MDLIIDIVKKTTQDVSSLFSDILVNKLGDRNKKIVEKTSKVLIIIINNSPEVSLQLVKLLIEFFNRTNQTMQGKAHAVAVLGNLKFEKMED